MHIQVSGKQIDLSDALKTRVATNLETIADKYFGHAIDAQVTFSRARSFFTCDINLHAGPGLVLRGEGEAADANTAFDDAAEHMAKRLRRHRRRLNDHTRLSGRVAAGESARETIFADGTDPDGLENEEGAVPVKMSNAIIAEQITQIAYMSVGDAAMRLDLSDDQLVMFRNSATDQINVVYRRHDGHVGWIDPSPAH